MNESGHDLIVIFVRQLLQRVANSLCDIVEIRLLHRPYYPIYHELCFLLARRFWNHQPCRQLYRERALERDEVGITDREHLFYVRLIINRFCGV